MKNTAQQQKYSALAETVHSVCIPPASPLRSRIHAISANAARSPIVHRMLAALLLVGIPGVGAYAYFVEPTWLEVKRLTVPLPHFPLALMVYGSFISVICIWARKCQPGFSVRL